MNIRNSKLLGLVVGLFLTTSAHAGLDLDGVDDFASTGIALSTFMSNSTGSMTMYYTPQGTASSFGPECYNGERLFIDFDNTNGSYAGLYRNGSYTGGVDRLCAYGWDGDETTIPSTYTVNARTHLAWVHSGGTLFFYKDGALVTSGALGNLSIVTGLVMIGLSDNGGGTYMFAEGVFEDLRIYSVALSANEVANLASGTHRMGPAAPSGYWPLDECADGSSGDAVGFIDRSGNGRTMTGNNGADNLGLSCVSTTLSYPWGVE